MAERPRFKTRQLGFGLLVTVAPLAAGFAASSLRSDNSSPAEEGEPTVIKRVPEARVETDGVLVSDPVELADLAEIHDLYERTRQLLTILNTASLDDLRAFFEETNTWPPCHGWLSNQPTLQVRTEIMKHWLARDPDDALEYVYSLGSKRLSGELDRFLFTLWGQMDPSAAIAGAKALENPAHTRHALLFIADVMSFDDPERVLDLCLSDPLFARSGVRRNQEPGWGSLVPNPMIDAIRTLTQRQPELAVQWFTRMPSEAQRETAGYVAYHYAAKDPDAAREWVAALADEQAREKATDSLIRKTFIDDYEKGLALVAAIPDENRDAFIKKLIADPNTKSVEQIDALLPLLSEEMKTGKSGVEIARAIGGLRGVEMTMSLTKPGSSETTRVIREWFGRDSGAVAQWSSSLDLQDTKERLAMRQVVRLIAEKDPLKGMEILESASAALNDHERGGIANTVASRYVTIDPQATYAWVRGLDEAIRAKAMYSAARSHWYDSRGTVNAMVESEPPGELRNAMAEAVMDNWFRVTGEMADSVKWLSNLREAPEELIKEAYGDWMDINITAVSAALNELPSGDTRDMAVGLLVEEIAGEDLEMAKQWAATITGAAARAKALKHIDFVENPPVYDFAWRLIPPDPSKAVR